VAVKLLVPGIPSTQEVLSRANERDWTAEGAHPGAPRVIELGLSDPDQPYVVSELLDGETLARRIGREPGLSEAELLEIGERIADIVAELHSRRIVHGKLDAEHVFLCRGGEVKLLGLDLPPSVHRRADDTGAAPETPDNLAELAPQGASGPWDGADGRADLLGLGALLFGALTGRPAHEAADPAEWVETMRQCSATPLASIPGTVPASIRAVVDTALAFSGGARYPDAATLALDLRAVRKGLPPPFAATRLHETLRVIAERKALDGLADAPRAAGVAHALIGTVLAGRFRIGRHLGSGAMGAVYLARHIHIKRAVAIKVLHREMSCESEVVARFEREAIAAARIDHPNVAAAHDFGRLEDGSFYLVLEYVQGESLRALLNREGPQSVPFALGVSRQIALALEAAHAAGVVHRDLKPENVMLRAAGNGEHRVKVLDFGIAKVNTELGGAALTRAGTIFGTPNYMSPEQALGRPVDGRTDLYALGVLLYEMLAGSTPFSSDNLVAVLVAQLTAPPPELPASVPLPVRQLVSTLLAKPPEERFQSAAEVVAAIDRAARPSVPSAGPSATAASGSHAPH
jgi:serine/threonine protein kinase